MRWQEIPLIVLALGIAGKPFVYSTRGFINRVCCSVGFVVAFPDRGCRGRGRSGVSWLGEYRQRRRLAGINRGGSQQ
jgi:hypothetical protein